MAFDIAMIKATYARLAARVEASFDVTMHKDALP